MGHPLRQVRPAGDGRGRAGHRLERANAEAHHPEGDQREQGEHDARGGDLDPYEPGDGGVDVGQGGGDDPHLAVLLDGPDAVAIGRVGPDREHVPVLAGCRGPAGPIDIDVGGGCVGLVASRIPVVGILHEHDAVAVDDTDVVGAERWPAAGCGVGGRIVRPATAAVPLVVDVGRQPVVDLPDQVALRRSGDRHRAPPSTRATTPRPTSRRVRSDTQRSRST